MLEFGVTSLAGLARWHANAYEVVLARGGVAQVFARVAARPKPNASTRCSTIGSDPAMVPEKNCVPVLTSVWLAKSNSEVGW
jgi:hypothetical protein